MNLKAKLGLDACAFDHAGETGVPNGAPRSDVNTNGDLSCSRWSRRSARSSSPRMGWVLGVPALTLRTCRVAVLKST
jgi:hypothetical protein